jgi:hypothetical protein
MDFAPAQGRTHLSTTKRNLFQSRLYGFSGHEFATFSDTQHKVDSARPLFFFFFLSALLFAILSRLHPSSSSDGRHGTNCQAALNDEASKRHNGLLVSRPYFNCSTHCIDRLLVLVSFFGRCFQVHGSALYDNKNTYWHPVYIGRPWEHISVWPSASEQSQSTFSAAHVSRMPALPLATGFCRRTQFSAF